MKFNLTHFKIQCQSSGNVFPYKLVPHLQECLISQRRMGVVWVCAVGQFRKKKKGEEKGHQTRKQLDWKVKMD